MRQSCVLLNIWFNHIKTHTYHINRYPYHSCQWHNSTNSLTTNWHHQCENMHIISYSFNLYIFHTKDFWGQEEFNPKEIAKIIKWSSCSPELRQHQPWWTKVGFHTSCLVRWILGSWSGMVHTMLPWSQRQPLKIRIKIMC